MGIGEAVPGYRQSSIRDNPFHVAAPGVINELQNRFVVTANVQSSTDIIIEIASYNGVIHHKTLPLVVFECERLPVGMSDESAQQDGVPDARGIRVWIKFLIDALILPHGIGKVKGHGVDTVVRVSGQLWNLIFVIKLLALFNFNWFFTSCYTNNNGHTYK